MDTARISPTTLARPRTADPGVGGVPALVASGTFPLIDRERGRGCSYLDSAATTQKPAAVIDAESSFYRESNANVHRGIHRLSVEATEAFEGARAAVARFVGASRPEEIVFCRGATEALNLLADSWGRPNLRPGDEIVLTTLEHHSNLVPWQMVAARTGARLVELVPDREGTVGPEALERAVGSQTRLLGMTHVSNVLGAVSDLRAAAAAAHRVGALFLVDGAQAVGHLPVDVREIGCDFYVASGHKMFAPTGTGFLWGRYELLDRLPPHLGGGDMIEEVFFDRSTYAELPARLEAGTPHVAGVVGLGQAVAFLEELRMERVQRHDQALLAHAWRRLGELPWLELYGPQDPARRSGLIAFNVAKLHAHDVGSVLDSVGVAVRTGHLCAQPTLRHLGIGSCVRASFALYNDGADVDRLVEGLRRTARYFGVA